MTMNLRRACVCAALVLVSVAAGSCTATEDESEPALGSVPVVGSEADLVLPLDAARLTQQEYGVVLSAMWRLTRNCVARFGVAFTQTEDHAVADPPNFSRQNARRYGLIDLASASRRGYNAETRSIGPDTPKPTAKPAGGWMPTSTEELVVRGKTWPGAAGLAVPTDADGKALPDDGCAGEASRLLMEGAERPADENLADNLADLAYHRSENDSRVVVAVRLWSECMKGAGHSYTTIWQPNDRGWPNPPGAEEIATATADVACKQGTNLAGIWFAVEAAYQQRYVQRNAEALEDLKDWVRHQARNAARVLTEG